MIGIARYRSAADAENGLLRVLLLLVLLAIATGSARAAMRRDPHELDRRLGTLHVRPRKPVLLCNPWSGGGKVDAFGLAEAAADLGVETVFLDKGLDLAQLAHDAIANGADCLGMAGGDGSQALVASIAIEHDIPFVCISGGHPQPLRARPRAGPGGPAHRAWSPSARASSDGSTTPPSATGCSSTTCRSASTPRSCSRRAIAKRRRQTSRQLLPELLGRQAEPFDLQFTKPDGVEVDGAFLVLVSNNPYVLGPALDISQRRSVETGVLGVVAVTARTGREAAAMVARSTAGLAARDPHIHQFTATSFEIRSHSGRVFAGVDGESLELDSPLTFAIHPRGLRLRVPVDSLDVAARRDAHGLRPRRPRRRRPRSPTDPPPRARGGGMTEVPDDTPASRGCATSLEEMSRLDRALYVAVAESETPTLDVALRRLSLAADKSKLWLGVAAVLAPFGGPAGRRAALSGVASIGVASASVNLLFKPLARRRRPVRAADDPPHARHVPMPSSTSFPSGHSASAFAFVEGVSCRPAVAGLPAAARCHRGRGVAGALRRALPG